MQLLPRRPSSKLTSGSCRLHLQTEVLTVVDQVALSPEEACGVLLGDKCTQDYDPFKQKWNILIPMGKPPVKPIPLPKVN